MAGLIVVMLNFNATVAALVESLARETRASDEIAPEQVARASSYVLATHASMPDYFRFPFRISTLTYHKECYFDVNPLLRMGWRPKYSNMDMLQESYDWFCNQDMAARNGIGSSPHRSPLKEGVLRLVKRFS